MERDESFFAVKNSAEQSIAVPSVGSDDEESFVVLGSSSFSDDVADGSLNDEVLPPIRSSKIHDMQNLIKMEISQINSTTSLPEMPSVTEALNVVTTSVASSTLSSDSSYEDKLKELIKENEKLKNIVEQNNLSMKTQYDRILVWKEEVNAVMQSYKTKFMEAKNYIQKCKDENAKLANDAKKYKEIKELQDEEIINLKTKEKIRDNQGVVSNSVEQNMIQFDLQIAKEKINDLQTELAESNLKKAELSVENEKLLQKLVTTPILEEELENKDKEIRDLKMQFETYNNREKSLTDDNVKLKNQIVELKESLIIETKQNIKLTESTSNMSSVETKLQENEVKMYKQQQEINYLKKINNSLSAEAENFKTQFQKLKQDYDPELYEKHEQVRQQLMSSQITITALEEEIRNKVKEIEELRQLLQSGSKNDEIFALNEQLTLYKNDFEAERESRNALKQEKDQIAEDLQNLQKRNKQLQQEIEKLRGNTKPDAFICPKCSFAFNTYQSLENHVHRCLDLDGFP